MRSQTQIQYYGIKMKFYLLSYDFWCFHWNSTNVWHWNDCNLYVCSAIALYLCYVSLLLMITYFSICLIQQIISKLSSYYMRDCVCKLRTCVWFGKPTNKISAIRVWISFVFILIILCLETRIAHQIESNVY